jgi:AraC-like DNA-binding protein
LALCLQVPEHVLRAFINRRLGYKNFSTYLNSWRLREARAALADAGQCRVPISTIALDSGFQSLGPFNRAFKAFEGMTPTQFRQQMLLRPPATA